jgi:hypothetical protein
VRALRTEAERPNWGVDGGDPDGARGHVWVPSSDVPENMLIRRLALGLLVWGSVGCQSRGLEPATRLEAPTVALASDLVSSRTPTTPRVAAPAKRDACAGRTGPTPVTLPERVTMGDFWSALGAQIDGLDTTALDPAFAEFSKHHDADASSAALRRDFMRLWAVFEATRDGGWWRLRWQVTDQEPSSVQIWKAWRRSPPVQSFATPSAVAECDEITALFSVTARRLGVRGVGLFYPTWNHVIAGWAPQGMDPTKPGNVVLVPTTQIFLGCQDTFDQTSFKPPKQVYEFPRYDVKDNAPMPAQLAAFLLEQVRAYGEASPQLLALVRTKRAELLQSSVGDCGAYRRRLRDEVAAQLSCADRRALRHLVSRELGRPELSEAAALAYLAEP